jgi:hypothetical protein
MWFKYVHIRKLGNNNRRKKFQIAYLPPNIEVWMEGEGGVVIILKFESINYLFSSSKQLINPQYSRMNM